MGQQQQRRAQGGKPNSESGISRLEFINFGWSATFVQTTCLKILFGHDPPHVPVRSYNGICKGVRWVQIASFWILNYFQDMD